MNIDCLRRHDRNYKFTTVPSFLLRGVYIQQAHKSIGRGSQIKVRVSDDATLYMAVEPSGRDGGFRKSLPKAGWTAINTRTTLNWDGSNKLVLFKKETLADTVTLPKTTTGQTVGCITVIEGLLPAVSVTETHA